MIAGAEKIDENGVQKIPPGMWIIPLELQLANNISHGVVQRISCPVDGALWILAHIICERMYDPSKYPNPCEPSSLQSLGQ
jgi:ATP-dependent DNA helicase 2 subunit 1